MKTADLRTFFYERLLEVFHKYTIDSHRVRCHNAYTLLLESIEVLQDWQNSNVKLFDTVRYCLEETLSAIKDDDCLTYNSYSKELLIADILTYNKNGKECKNQRETISKLIFAIKSIVKENRQRYLIELFQHLESILLKEDCREEEEDMSVLIKIDSYITSLATQLLHEGYSKIYLFKLVDRSYNDLDRSFADKFHHMKMLLCGKSLPRMVTIMRIPVVKSKSRVLKSLDLKDSIPEELLSEDLCKAYRKFVSPTKASKYYIFNNIVAKDAVSAVKETRETISSILDSIHLGDSATNVSVPLTGLVITYNSDSSQYSEMATEYVLDGNTSIGEINSRRLIEDIKSIQTNQSITSDVWERLKAAMRHLRIGDQQDELEQRFINYWIALEFIFAAPEVSESTFIRLKTNLVNLLTACYMKRNFLDLNNVLVRLSRLRRGQHIWEMSEEEITGLISSESNPLIKYRLRKIKSLLGHTDKRKSYIQAHEKNVSYHIVRIYRLRNELIHEAAIKQDIESVTSNLRYYLLFLISQIIMFYSSYRYEESEKLTLDNFFYSIEMCRNRICETYEIERIMGVPFSTTLIC